MADHIQRTQPEAPIDDEHRPIEAHNLEATALQKPTKLSPVAEATLTVLSPFAKSPLDVILEIFTHLHPKDLIRLAKTNKRILQLLRMSGAGSVWKAARQNSRAPAGPSNMSEMQWCLLVFGETCCQIPKCNERDLRHTNFIFRVRVCSKCKAENILKSRTRHFKKTYPESLLELVPYEPNLGSNGKEYPHYWKPEVDDVAKQLELHDREIRSRVPGSVERLARFRFERKTLVKEIMGKINEFESFETRVRAVESEERLVRRKKQVVDRYMELGYILEDVESSLHHDIVYQDKELTDEDWDDVLVVTRSAVQRNYVHRLEREQEELLKRRKEVVRTLYRSYKESYFASTDWAYLPLVDHVCGFEPFYHVLVSPNDYEISTDEFQVPMEILMELITDWMEMKKQVLMAEINDAKAKIKDSKGADEVSTAVDAPVESSSADASIIHLIQEDIGELEASLSQIASTSKKGDSLAHDIHDHSAEIVDPLSLATSVFKCVRDICHIQSQNTNVQYIGWEMAGAHHCYSKAAQFHDDLETRLKFCERSSLAAASLVKRAGLDPQIATPKDMDEKDLRFICTTCSVGSQTTGRAVLTWRAAVSHVAKGCDHPALSWEALDTQRAEAVKGLETPDPEADDKAWSCNHCFEHLDDKLDTMAAIHEHLRDRHSITDIKPVDLFINPAKRWLKFNSVNIP